MKLGTLRDGTRDGRLVVVSGDVTLCSDAHHIAPTLQHAIETWDRVAPHLDLIARGVESGGQPLQRFHEREARAPLPRAYQWAEAIAPNDAGSGFRQRASDAFADPRAPIRTGGAGIVLGAGVAVILGDVTQGADAKAARAAIRLVMLVVASPGEEAGRWSPAPTFSPVAVTPEVLAAGWDGDDWGGALTIEVNGKPRARLGPRDIRADFSALIVAAAAARPLAAGSILSSGPLGGAEINIGAGDTVRIEMRDSAGHSIFGAIERVVEPADLAG